MKIVRLEDAISEAKRLAEKSAVKESADEFVEIVKLTGSNFMSQLEKPSKMSFQFPLMKIQETFSCWFLKEKSNSHLKEEKKQ